jgi:hypothetical protein
MNRTLAEEYMARGWKNDGSLPPGWEEMIDAETGQPFYVDHNTRTTSWVRHSNCLLFVLVIHNLTQLSHCVCHHPQVDPRDVFIKKSTFSECQGDELPFGWEEAFDPTVGVYFVDHNTWSTQLEDPRTNKYAEQVSELQVFLMHAKNNIRQKVLEVILACPLGYSRHFALTFHLRHPTYLE